MDEPGSGVPLDDTWASGDAYERYVGRWSREVAALFVPWLAVPGSRRWLDVGCGTGALSQAILTKADPAGLLGLDPSEGFIEHARAQTPDVRARFEVGDAQDIKLPDEVFDATVSGLALNFVSSPETAVAEMSRVTLVGGVVAAYVWDYAEGMQLMRFFWDAATEVDPAAADLDEGRRFPLCAPGPLAELFEGSGLTAVTVRSIEIPTSFRDFDDLWNPFLGGQAPAPAYATSLNDETRSVLRERFRTQLPVADDGSIDLVARAWAVKAIRS